jgi:hypothetical protein
MIMASERDAASPCCPVSATQLKDNFMARVG